ncbi:MAG TPA: AraC family transcriptional regulator [Gemmatimonadota bacterium]|nr:AraC family transcriptional regulator [Gemmatimonadota bacterium]
MSRANETSSPSHPRGKYVPVTLGSPRFHTLDVGAFRVTDAWFPPGLRLEPHVHERAILGVMLEGGFDDVFPTRTFDCDAGKVFTEPRGDRHANRIFRTGARVVVIQPDPERPEEVGPAAAVFERAHCFGHGRITLAARALRRELRATDEAAVLARQGLIYEVIAAARRAADRMNGAEAPPPWLRRAREVVYDRFREPLRIEDVAREVDRHPAHVARVFRRHHGMTIGECVRTLRLDWAAGELTGTGKPLAAIAMEAGYADQSHFTRSFRRHTGSTPAEYRRLLST